MLRVKGTHDALDLQFQNSILTRIKRHLATYNFNEIATPILEHTELFTRTLGQHTDVVSKEMFLIQSHGSASQSESICLRPEMTASVVRAFVENGVQMTPWNVYQIGPCFRYERPQKGRFREFHQISMEIIGTVHTASDVQLITMLDRLFHETLLCNDYALHINYLGCPSDRAAYKIILKSYLDAHADKLCAQCLERKEKNIMRVFDCKVQACQDLYKKAPVIIDHLCKTCTDEWQQLQHTLELLSVSPVVKPTLVRGLDYYNKTVFEFVSASLGAQNTFCGGGRYDTLATELGAKVDQPSIGAAIGIERLMLILEAHKEKFSLTLASSLCAILPVEKEQHALALLLADELRAKHKAVELIFGTGSLKNLLSKANKLGAAYALILGQEEQQKNEVTVKNMVTGAQERIPQSKVVEYLQ